MSDTDDTFNFLVIMAFPSYSTCSAKRRMMCTAAGLPVHVRCLIDESANIGQIPKLEKLMATIRSREISACLVFAGTEPAQSHLQGQRGYHHRQHGHTFSWAVRSHHLKELAAVLGKETIDTYNTGENRGREVSHG